MESFDAVEISADMATEYLVTDRLQDIHIKRKNSPENPLRAEFFLILSVVKNLLDLAAVGKNVVDKCDKHKYPIYKGNDRNGFFT